MLKLCILLSLLQKYIGRTFDNQGLKVVYYKILLDFSLQVLRNQNTKNAKLGSEDVK